MLTRSVLLAVALLAAAIPAGAQPIFAQPFARGFSLPVAFVQNPADPSVQFVVQQGGRIRVIKSGVVQTNDFLNIPVFNSGECGLLGLAFPADYATSGRFYVYFCAPWPGSGPINVVVARFLRSADPLQADPASRFDLVWPGTGAVIPHPFSNHKGGNMAFGPDGFLYIGLGDGGGGNDLDHNAQNPLKLLGKMVRIDVSSVDLFHPTGYVVPATNPYAGRVDVLNEIWAFGLRNPWRWSIDPPALGGTGAIVIGDVGQGAWEEVDYQPLGAGGRNYGWRNREGLHPTPGVPAFPGPFLDPGQALVDPIHEYAGGSASITGGWIYRGTALGGAYAGRYLYADFVRSKVFSVALSVDPVTHEATVVGGSLIDHSAALGLGASLPSSFGIDAAGEIYICSYGSGRIYKLVPAITSDLRGAMDSPPTGEMLPPFTITGWAGDFAAQSGTGVTTVHLWAAPTNGGSAIFLGQSYGLLRPDIQAQFGNDMAVTGFSVNVNSLPFGRYNIVAYALSQISGTFQGFQVSTVDIIPPAAMAIESPGSGASLPGKVMLSGFAIDLGATSGTGVDTVHVWGLPPGGGSVFIGAATYGAARPSVASIFGAQFLNSGWSITAANLPLGPWTFVAYLHSSVTGTFRTARILNVTVTDGLRMFVDMPANGQVIPPGATRTVSGWAVDVGAAAGTGVDAVHVWVVNVATSAPTFLGAATLGGDRPDVAAAFGSSQFRFSGYTLNFSLPAGTYDLIVFGRSARTLSFDIARVVRINVQ